MGIQALPTGVHGPLPPGTVGLLLGRSSTILRGIQVHPGVIDQDSEGEIKIMTSVGSGVVAIPAGERIAQLLLLPTAPCEARKIKEKRGNQGFGSTGPAAFWVATMENRPQLTLKIEGKSFRGVLDSGADFSVLSDKFWPPAWPKEEGTVTLQGIGQAVPQKSLRILKWQDSEGHTGLFQPYVLPGLPINLWGRDLMQEMGVVLTTQAPKSKSRGPQMTQGRGWSPGRELGKLEQGEVCPVASLPLETRAPGDRKGFGHF